MEDVFDVDIKCEKRCGEIYLNIKGLMIFHCTLCEEKFNGFEKYVQHVGNVHDSELFPCSVKEELGGSSDSFCNDKLFQSINSDSDTNLNDLIAPSNCNTDTEEADILKEAEISIQKLKKKNKTDESTSKGLTSKAGVVTAYFEINDNDSEEDNEPKFSLTNDETEQREIRPIQKKTNYFPTKNDVRPFQCNYCDSAFKDQTSLKKHKARHRTEKVHPCPECHKMFYTNFDMRKHLKAHAGTRPFLCDLCGKTFISNVKLKDHMRRHTGQRDYECTDCGKRFYNSNLLLNHKLVHKTEKSFACTFCDARFTFRKGLRNHLKLHANKREYKCDLCDADFNQQAGLFCHKKTKHQIG